ncbi:hypothetical protein P7K49_000254, partial [Saguinus oedipus]
RSSGTHRALPSPGAAGTGFRHHPGLLGTRVRGSDGHPAPAHVLAERPPRERIPGQCPRRPPSLRGQSPPRPPSVGVSAAGNGVGE